MVCGLSSGKLYGLGPAGFPTVQPFVAKRRFPIIGQSAAFLFAGPNYHLVHTLIPDEGNSLGVFLHDKDIPLASFANTVSYLLPSPWTRQGINFSHNPPYSLKAGYAVHRFDTAYRFNPKP